MAAATPQRQERKRGVSRHHTEQGTHDKPMSASRHSEKRQEEVLRQKERAAKPSSTQPRGSLNLSAHLHSWRTTDGRHEPEKKSHIKPFQLTTQVLTVSSSFFWQSLKAQGDSDQRCLAGACRSPQNTPPRSTLDRSKTINLHLLHKGTK